MSNVISSGVKITVDTTDLDVKFLKSVEQLNASLTKSQKALKLVYNEQGLLTNALGKCVEGLSASQIKLGQYVDELGPTRTTNWPHFPDQESHENGNNSPPQRSANHSHPISALYFLPHRA